MPCSPKGKPHFLVSAFKHASDQRHARTRSWPCFQDNILESSLHAHFFLSRMASHLRHHRFTQNPPFDLENPAPIRITFRDFLSFGFVNVKVVQKCSCLGFCMTLFCCRVLSVPSQRLYAPQCAFTRQATWAGLGNGKRCDVSPCPKI